MFFLNRIIFKVEEQKLSCVSDRINYSAPYFNEKMSIIINQIKKHINCTSNEKIFYVDDKNFKNVLNDLEIESFFCELFFCDNSMFPYENKFVFLISISEQGYNFGQFRIISHLIKLGYKQENFILFPLTINNNEYIYNKDELKKVLLNENCSVYICETAYIGWEQQLKELNEYIKSIGNYIIMTGGPLTSSHLEFCCKFLNTDIIMTGHGEYVFEAFLKEVFKQKTMLPKVSIPEVFYAKECTNFVPVNLVNKYIDFLYWDLELLYRLYQFVPVINLFTSEECKGNCIFCYRYSVHENNSIKNKILLKRLEEIVAFDKFRKYEKVYIRFFDDDFFASNQRNSDFIEDIIKVLGENFAVFELTFSIRSIYKLYKMEGDNIFKSLSRMNLKRVTIGVDGFNNNDLIYLQKGYRMDKVFEIADKLNEYGMNTLMYCILTTPNTNYIDLFESLKNIIQLVLKGNVFIGPTITPNIYVQNANQKLYPQFKGDNIKYLDVESFHKRINNFNEIYDSVMSAKLLSKDYLVRKFNLEVANPNSVESAYIIPLICAYMKICAQECNLLNELLEENNANLIKRIKDNIVFVNNEITIFENNYNMHNDKTKQAQINEYLSLKRELDELNSYLVSKNDLTNKLSAIFDIVKEYYYFYLSVNENRTNYETTLLTSSIIRLLILPLKVFYKELGDSKDLIDLKQTVNEIKCLINEKEYEILKKYIERNIHEK